MKLIEKIKSAIAEGQTFYSSEGPARVLLVGLNVGRCFVGGQIAHAQPG